jgi:hypothetical protein
MDVSKAHRTTMRYDCKMASDDVLVRSCRQEIVKIDLKIKAKIQVHNNFQVQLMPV